MPRGHGIARGEERAEFGDGGGAAVGELAFEEEQRRGIVVVQEAQERVALIGHGGTLAEPCTASMPPNFSPHPRASASIRA